VLFSVRGPRYKFIYHGIKNELYDIINDPEETKNIIEQFPALSAHYRLVGLGIVLGGEAFRDFDNPDIELDDEQVKELKDLGYLQ
jgi:hypothetical protein